ncbi:unnamed protein product [Diatraea saccharalis]|uniref:Uncharacterized protein n=1 Tax=Diatraea saccharalis TaxID=40085 RepID=A0A9N9R2G7_9NEOP|nr:unnamed protein product [Diatraea saccharalis]
MLFDTIRRHGGYNRPNLKLFKEIFKKILQRLEIKKSFLGNCVPLEDIPVLTCSSSVKNINSTVSGRVFDECDSHEGSFEVTNQIIEEADHIVDGNVKVLSIILNRESIKKTTDQIIGYIAGWVNTS